MKSVEAAEEWGRVELREGQGIPGSNQMFDFQDWEYRVDVERVWEGGEVVAFKVKIIKHGTVLIPPKCPR